MDDRQAFVEFIRKHGEKAYNFAFRLAGNETAARDLVQDAFTRAFERRDRYDPEKAFDSWLLKILQNIYLDQVRKETHHRTVSLDAEPPVEAGSWDEVLPGPDPDPAEGMMRMEADRRVQKALEALPVHFRTAVTLSDIEGFSYEKIGSVMACPVGTVRSRIHQGRVLLRRALGGPKGTGESYGRP